MGGNPRRCTIPAVAARRSARCRSVWLLGWLRKQLGVQGLHRGLQRAIKGALSLLQGAETLRDPMLLMDARTSVLRFGSANAERNNVI